VQYELDVYEDSTFDCNNWFGQSKSTSGAGVQFTGELVSAHDLARCSKSLSVDFNTSWDFAYFAALRNLTNATDQAAFDVCKFSEGTSMTPQDVVLDAGARSAPVAAELMARKHLSKRTDGVYERLGMGTGPQARLLTPLLLPLLVVLLLLLLQRRALAEDEGEDDDPPGVERTPSMRGRDEVCRGAWARVTLGRL
jgi:hypothetical protein